MPYQQSDIGRNRLLATVIGANMNSTADQAFVKNGAWSTGFVDKITVRNASISLTTVQGGIYTAASKAGTAIVAASQAYSALTTAFLGIDLTVTAGGKSAASLITNMVLSLTTGQGAAATADFYLYGYVVS